MGLSWQQGPLSTGPVGKFIVPEPLPKRLLYVERLRRRMRVRLEDVGSPKARMFSCCSNRPLSGSLLSGGRHLSKCAGKHRAYDPTPDLGLTSWYSVRADEQHVAPRGAWQHTGLPAYASELQGRVAFAWRAMDAFYEEDERIMGHAADPYHRIDIRQTSRNLVVRHGDRIIADTKRPLVLYESGFAPRWYVPREDIDESALTPVKHQTFCPYKGLCSYYDIGDARQAAWSYPDAYPEVRRISNLVSFEPDIVTVHLDGTQLHLEPGQSVIPHGPDRNLDLADGPRGERLVCFRSLIKAKRRMARLLSVNVGLPRDIEWKGRTVHTAIWKNPVHGRCRVGRLNLDGDGQGDLGGHGGEQRAVFVYQIESYRYWQEQLKQDRFRARTVRRELHDRRIARRCRLHRRPLSDRQRAVRSHAASRYLLSRRHSDQRAADAGVADIQRTAGVLLPRPEGRRGGRRRRNREGRRGERANDRRRDQRAALFAPSSARSTGARVADRGAFARMARVVRGFAAEPDNVAASGNAGLVPAAAAHPVAPGFRPLTVTAIDQESADVLSLTMRAPDGQPLQQALPASMWSCVFDATAGGPPLFRSYSLSGPLSTERYRISVKIEPNGAAGTYLREHVRVGDALDVSAPRGSFHSAAGERPVVLLSAGIGVTPVLAMLHALAAARSTRQVLWLHAARDGQHHPFAAEVRRLMHALAHGRSYVCYSKPDSRDKMGEDFDATGHLSRSVFDEVGVPRRGGCLSLRAQLASWRT